MTLPVCVLDVETRSTIKLGKGGTNAFVYAQHPTTEVWLLRYAFDDAPHIVLRWGYGRPCPQNLIDHVTAGGIICAHNAGFEFAVWTQLLTPRYGWPELKLSQMSDTAARAARIGIPRALEKAAPALGLAHSKDMAGSKLMKQMAKPRKVHRFDPMDPDNDEIINQYLDDPLTYTDARDGVAAIFYEWWADNDRVERLGAYCDDDVRTQMDLHLHVPELPPMEWKIWQLTMRANVRGCLLDMPFINKAIAIIERNLKGYAEELLDLSGGQVKSHTDLNGMKAFAKSQGVPVDSLAAGIVGELIKDPNVPSALKRVLTIRSEAGKSSVAKFPAMKRHADGEGIARDQLVYYGAQSTGRWSALGFQLHNLPSRGLLKYDEAEWVIQIINESDTPYDLVPGIEAITGLSIIEVLSMCLRGAIKARPGKQIICADYSNIEGRIGAWLGGEQWKLDAFKAYDDGEGPDLYKVTAGGILGINPEDVDKTQRNVLGKVSELALGFQGGVGAYVSMGNAYGINMEDYADTIKQSLFDYWESALENYDNFGKGNTTLSKTAWVASETVKLAWRSRHPGIVNSWRGAEDAAIAAVETPGKPFYFCDGKLALLAKSIQGKLFLLLRLPSGRCIHYANVKLVSRTTPWGAVKKQITFDKVEQGRIIRSSTYGGDIFQSAVQGSARDIMAHGWLTVDDLGYPGLFSVHDELASEIDKGLENLAEYEDLLCDLPSWAEGCPISATGYISDRFRKD